MKRILSFILFLGLIISSFSQVPVWNLSNSSINLLLENSTSINYTIYKDIKLSLIKEISKTNDGITQKNYVEFNGKISNTTWEGIQQIYEIEGNTYVCPTGKNHLSIYSNNEFKELIDKDFNFEQEWDFTCNHLGGEKNIIFISYLAHNDGNIYGYKIQDKNWFKLPIHKGHLDIVWSNDIDKDSRLFFFSMLIGENNKINIGRLEVTLRDKYSISMSGSKGIREKLDKTYAYFDEQKYFIWIAHNDTHFYSGYSEDKFDNISFEPNDNIIKDVVNTYSPFEYFGNIKINYVKLIKNTKYAFYEISDNNKTYHGIIDVKLNKILFNSDEDIKDFKPLVKNALLVVTDKSAYKLCTFALNEKGDDCIDQCPEGQSLILDPINNNHCGVENKCQKYIFKPMDYCIDECNNSTYVIQNETICGLCKFINETHPYKIISQDFCINEKPNNTYFIDEGKKLLNYCHSSCETCFGEKDDQCLSCKNGYMKKEGKCSDKCPDGYYKDSNGTCQVCNSNCLTCKGPSIEGNNNCQSCDPNKNESILIEAEGFPSNCVSECPNNTILNGVKCIKSNSTDDSTPSGNKGESQTDYLIYIFIILIIIIIIVLGLILFKKCRSKKKGDEQLITNINNEINENELKENRIVD